MNRRTSPLLTVAVDPVNAGDHGLRRVHNDVAPARPQGLVRQARVTVGYAPRLAAPDVRRRFVDHDGGGVFDVQTQGRVRALNLKWQRGGGNYQIWYGGWRVGMM